MSEEEMIPIKNILVTGMSGLIGGVAGRELARRGYNVSALNRQDVRGFRTTRASITDLNAIRPAFQGIDCVVHMAAYLGPSDALQLSVNIEGTYNVFEAAKEAGVKRFVFGSSGATQMGYEREEPVRSMVEARYEDIPDPPGRVYHDSPARPDRMYGVAKAAGEIMGRYYSETHGISVICIKLGRVTAEDRPDSPRNAAVYLSQRDAAQIVWRCVEAPADVRYGIVYGVSDNRTRFRDLEHTTQLVGYVPEDGAG
jgi:nucleoside-diphosphate-sugar epimerase